MLLVMDRLGLDYELYNVCKMYLVDLQRTMAREVRDNGSVPPHLQAVHEYRRAIINSMISLNERFRLGHLTAEEVASRNEELVVALGLDPSGSRTSAG